MVKERDYSFIKKLISVVVPVAFQQFMLALVSASDAFMLGILSQDSLSAVSLASQVSFVENLFLASMTIGLSILVAQYWGKSDTLSIERITSYILRITFVISFLFMVVSFAFSSQIMRIFTNDELLIEQGSVYLKWVAISFLITGISQIYLCILKNIGESFKVSVISCFSVVVNIVLNSIFIFGLCGLPKLGIKGAALATLVSKVIEIIWCNIEMRRNSLVKINFFVKKDDEIVKKFWKYCIPVLCNEIVWGIGFTMFSVIIGHLGNDAVAANGIANIIKNLVACFCLGLGNGAGIIVGNELGAGHLDIAKRYGKKLTFLSIICGVISGVILLVISPFVLKYVSLNEMSSYYLRYMLIICSYYMIGKSINSTLIAGIFCAGGDSKFGFICDTVTLWVIIIPFGCIAAFVMNVPVIWVYFILSLDEIIKLPVVFIHYRKYLWVKDLTIKEKEEC